MAILTIEQMTEALKNFIGDRTDEEALVFMENVMDTVKAASEDNTKEVLQKKIDTLIMEKETLDAVWRARYKERFFERPIIESNGVLDMTKDPVTEPVTFEDLFEETEE